MKARHDIQTAEDIQAIVHAFYTGIAEDPVIGRFFEGLDLAAHLPKLGAFWSSIVFQTATYRGRPFDAHVGLSDLRPEHFDRWLQRFRDTIDTRFAGERAEFMKQRAEHIATIFQWKLGMAHEAGWRGADRRVERIRRPGCALR